jgi:Pvc16 N-terminal domain
MSQEAAVAVVTRVFRQMVIQALRDLQPRFGTDNLLDLVTILPPDQARENRTGSQVNLYLYQVALNAAWRNQDIPGRSRPNEIAPPALPLNVH